MRWSRGAGGREVIGEARTVAEPQTLIEETPPAVVILDVVLPDGVGIRLCRDIRSEHPERPACC